MLFFNYKTYRNECGVGEGYLNTITKVRNDVRTLYEIVMDGIIYFLYTPNILFGLSTFYI